MAEGMTPADVGAVVNNNRGYGYGYDGAGWGMGGMGIGLFAILFLVLFAGGGAAAGLQHHLHHPDGVQVVLRAADPIPGVSAEPDAGSVYRPDAAGLCTAPAGEAGPGEAQVRHDGRRVKPPLAKTSPAW